MPQIVYNFVASGADSIANAYQSSTKAAEKAARAAEKAAERQAQAEIRAGRKVIDAAARSQEKRLADQERAASKAIKIAERQAQAEVRAAQKANDQIRAERSKLNEQWAEAVGGKLKAAALTAGALALGTIGAAAREDLALRGTANRISIAGHTAGQPFANPAQIAQQIQDAAIAHPGINSEALAGGVKTIVEMTHDLPGAMAQLDTLATSMQAMGTDAEGTARVMVALRNSFGITEPKAMQDAIAKLNAQMKQAGVPLEAMEGHVLAMAATAARFGFKGSAGIEQMGGMIALAKSGVGDPERAEKGAGRVLDKITEHAAQLQAMGVKIHDRGGELLPLQQIIGGLISKIGGSNMALKRQEIVKLFGGGERGGAAVLGHAETTYINAFQAAKGSDTERTAAAMAALNEELGRIMGTTASYRDLQEEAGRVQQSAGSQLAGAWEKLKGEVGEAVVPALLEMVPSFTKIVEAMLPLVPAIGKVVDALAGFVQFLIDKDIVHETVKATRVSNPREMAKQAREELGALESSIKNPMEMTREQAEKRQDLHERIRVADEAAAEQKRTAGTEESIASDQGSGHWETEADAQKRLSQFAADTTDASKASKDRTTADQAAAKAASALADRLMAAADAAARSKPLNQRAP